MKFSVIMPSLLSDFPGAATERPAKLIRAVNSVLSQLFNDFELIIISDGCSLTSFLVKRQITDSRVKLMEVDRKKLWSNTARNAGIEAATGEYIVYLDNDDRWGEDHLKIINDQLNAEDWVYANDWVYHKEQWMERASDPAQYGRIGTSNICHRSSLGLRWNEAGYGHDYFFIQQLLKFPNYKQISAAQYYVCHFNGGYAI